jgi:hypothetical protein
MTRQEVITRLCELVSLVNAEVFQFRVASDCFCEEGNVNFQFEEEVIRFIEDAVKEKLEK